MGLFIQAVRSVFASFGAALRIALLPMAVLMTVNLWALDPGFDRGILPEAIAAIVDFTIACWIAVGWHRYALLAEEPGQFAPNFSGTQIGGYFITWFVVGLVVLLPVLAVTLSIYWLVMLVLGGGGLIDVMASNVFVGGYDTFWIDLGFGWLMTWGFLYLFFRVGVTLPAKAAYGYGIALRKGFALTKQAAGEILGTALIASAFVVVLFATSFVLYDFSAEPSEIRLIVSSLVEDLAYVINVLFGAAIFNVIFKRCLPQAALEAELNDQ